MDNWGGGVNLVRNYSVDSDRAIRIDKASYNHPLGPVVRSLDSQWINLITTIQRI